MKFHEIKVSVLIAKKKHQQSEEMATEWKKIFASCISVLVIFLLL